MSFYEDFSVRELRAELKRIDEDEKIKDAIADLKDAGCPIDLIRQLRGWEKDTVTKQDLQKWKEWTGVK